MAKIVIVDDEVGLKDLLGLLLEELGHKVSSAVNGQEALTLIEQIVPELVISDVMMPIMDGYTLLENVRLKKIQWPTLKIVLISAASIRRQGENWADEYMSKPYDLETLETVVERMLVSQ